MDLKQLSRRLLEEAYGEGRFDALDELVRPDVQIHDHAIVGELSGHAGMKASVVALRHAIPDLELTVESQIAEGDQVASRFRLKGTQSGDAVGIPAGEAPEEGAYSFPPTKEPVALTGMAVDRFADGRHAERWLEWDNAGLMRTLGLLPDHSSRASPSVAVPPDGEPRRRRSAVWGEGVEAALAVCRYGCLLPSRACRFGPRLSTPVAPQASHRTCRGRSCPGGVQAQSAARSTSIRWECLGCGQIIAGRPVIREPRAAPSPGRPASPTARMAAPRPSPTRHLR